MSRTMDPLALLTAEHRRLQQLIQRLTTTRDLAMRVVMLEKLTDTLTELLAVKHTLVYPRVRSIVKDGVMAELIAEQVEIKRVLANLIWLDVDDELFDVLLDTLVTLIEGHVLWQEDELFDTVAFSMTVDERATHGTDLVAWFDERAWQPTALSAAA